MAERILTLRELNRALLARQLLLERARLSPARAIERVGALQAQWSPAPYVALWTRLEDFSIPQLERALARKSAVKATLMRSTLHLVSSADYPVFAAAIVDARRAKVERLFPLDLDVIAKRLREATTEPPQSWDAWRELMISLAGRPIKPGEIWPLWTVAFMHARLVHLPPSGTYSFYRGAHFVPYEEWVGAAPDVPLEPMRHLLRRYLAAFGPATIDDMASWMGVPTPAVRAVLDVAPRTFRDEAGRLLYDVPRAPLPASDTPAPVRLLPKWDSSLLAYSPPERARLLPDPYRKRVIAPNGDVAQTVLVDGFVAGTWKVEKKRLRVEPFARLPRAVREELTTEEERLLAFLP
ncbi:MAG: winged helix DNA-binding domain-containing protein [Gaiellales bacterium]